MNCSYSCARSRGTCLAGGILERRSVLPQPLHSAQLLKSDGVLHRHRVVLSAASSFTALVSKEMFLLTCRATFKLAMGCSGIMLLFRSGRIPSTAPQVLSKLAFNVTIPSTLFIKSAETLASAQGDLRYLLVPLIAAVQVRHSVAARLRMMLNVQPSAFSTLWVCWGMSEW